MANGEKHSRLWKWITCWVAPLVWAAAGCTVETEEAVRAPIEKQSPLQQVTQLDIFVASQDSWISRGTPNRNDGAGPSLVVGGDHNDKRALVEFELSNVPINLTKATLVLSLRDDPGRPGPGRAGFCRGGGRHGHHRCDSKLIAIPLTKHWTEGNGASGPGVTWACPTDTNIANRFRDCHLRWNGGLRGSDHRGGIGHANGAVGVVDDTAGTVEFDVTGDVTEGAPFGWLIAGHDGCDEVAFFYSREGATAAGNADLAPRLILENPSHTVGADGGTVVAAGGKVVLEIPPGALQELVPITITPTSMVLPSSGLVAGTLYDFAPSGLEFLIPANLTIQYDPAAVASGVDPASLVILSSVHAPDEELTTFTPWEERPSTSNTTTSRVTGTIEHFSHDGVGNPVVAVVLPSGPIQVFLAETTTITANLLDATGTPLLHIVDWRTSNAAAATAVPLSLAGATTGLVNGLGIGTASITASVRNSPPPGAESTVVVQVVARPRRATITGSVFVFDDDSGELGDHEQGTFSVNIACDVSTDSPTSSVQFGFSSSFCVDNEVQTGANVDCALGLDNQTITITFEAVSQEGDQCGDNTFVARTTRVYTLLPGASTMDLVRAADTDGNFAEYDITVTNTFQP